MSTFGAGAWVSVVSSVFPSSLPLLSSPLCQLLAARKDIGGHSGTHAVTIAPVKAVKALEVRSEAGRVVGCSWASGLQMAE